MHRIDEVKNKIPENRDYEEHVNYIFEHVIKDKAAEDAKIDVVGLEWTGRAAIQYLAANWSNWSSRIGGICLASPQHSLEELAPAEFANFISSRCRAYFISDSPIGTAMAGHEDFGCGCYASGEEMYPENIIVPAWGDMLEWLNGLHA